MAVDLPNNLLNLSMWFPEYFQPDLYLLGTAPSPTILPFKKAHPTNATHKPTKRPHRTTTTHKPKRTTTHRPPRTTTKRPHRTTTHRPHRTTTHKPHRTTTHRPHRTTTHRPHRTTTKHPHRTTTHRPHPNPPTNHPHHTTHPHHTHHTIHTTHDRPWHPTPTQHYVTPSISEEVTEESSMEEQEQEEETTDSPEIYNFDLSWDDATWIMICAFMIFAMQTGFGMLEAGCVSQKNQANIMMKNVADIIFGGFSYWLFGFSLSFGTAPGSNPFAGVGEYVVDANYDRMGPVFVQFIFQLSFATTSTTIVSGTIAERFNFKAYCIFSFFNTIIYSVSARWVWGPGGWLAAMGCVDIAGSGAVHLLGGASGYVAAWMVGPRLGRFEKGREAPPMSSPVNCVIGLYILWWGWLAFNCGSTFGVTGDLWKFAARASVTTILASIGGGLIGSLWGFFRPGGKGVCRVMDVVNPVLGSLVAVTAGCALYHPGDAIIIGVIGGMVTILFSGFAELTRVDDVVGATPVHGFCGIWGLLAVGFFAEADGNTGFSKGRAGLFRGGSAYLLGVQALAALCIVVWALVLTFLLLFVRTLMDINYFQLINLILPIRMTAEEELLGADLTEHGYYSKHAEIGPALSVFGSDPHIQALKSKTVAAGGNNPAHDAILHALREINGQRRWRKFGFASTTTITAISSKFKTIARKQHKENQIEHYDDYNVKGNEYGVNNNPSQFEFPWNYRDILGAPADPVEPRRY